MNGCQRCSQFPKLESAGFLWFYSKNPLITEKLFDHSNIKLKNEQTILYSYQSFDELEKIMRELDKTFSNQEKIEILGTYSKEKDNQSRFMNMTPFPMLLERLQHREYVTIINQGLFTQHMQPIIQLQSDHVFGYEFLVRSLPNSHSFFPGELFSFSQRAGLQSNLDSQARIASIEVSSQKVKAGIKRFINFLPSSIYDPNHCLKSTFRAVKDYNVDPNDLVFEVVETEKIEDISHLKSIFSTYQAHGIKVALDDLGSGYSTLEVLRELKPNFAKIDRTLVDHCDSDKEKQERIKAIVDIAGEHQIELLAEGIERAEEAEFCKQIGVPLAQGYYFGKPDASPLQHDRLNV